jgi:hypothetical protein
MIRLVLAVIIAVVPAREVLAVDASDEMNVRPVADQGSDEDDLLAPLHVSSFRFVGSHSCISTACHGSLPIDRTYSTYSDAAYQGMEFQFWFANDPHARAKNTLASEKSRKILTLLLRQELAPNGISADSCSE